MAKTPDAKRDNTCPMRGQYCSIGMLLTDWLMIVSCWQKATTYVVGTWHDCLRCNTRHNPLHRWKANVESLTRIDAPLGLPQDIGTKTQVPGNHDIQQEKSHTRKTRSISWLVCEGIGVLQPEVCLSHFHRFRLRSQAESAWGKNLSSLLSPPPSPLRKPQPRRSRTWHPLHSPRIWSEETSHNFVPIGHLSMRLGMASATLNLEPKEFRTVCASCTSWASSILACQYTFERQGSSLRFPERIQSVEVPDRMKTSPSSCSQGRCDQCLGSWVQKGGAGNLVIPTFLDQDRNSASQSQHPMFNLSQDH